MTPKETDTALAALWHEVERVEQQIGSATSTLLHYAGARYYYRGSRRVTDMTIEIALAILTAEIARVEPYRAAHRRPAESDGYIGTDWAEWTGVVAPYDLDRIEPAIARRVELFEQLDELRVRIDALEATYTGWSRFFLVTSSAGHVHSSTHCSTCRPTTRFGWLPELSGKDEATAVAELGPTLCSVCYPSAPVDWTTGKKLTAAQAARKAA